MDERTMARMLQMRGEIEKSAYTLALAKNQENPEIKALVERMEDLQKSLQEQQIVTQKIQQELQVEQESLRELIKPLAEKEMEGIEKTS